MKHGRPQSEETRAKLRAAKLGKRHSPEHRAAISAAVKASGIVPPDAAQRHRFLAGLNERQQAEFCELVDRHRYTNEEAFAAARLVGSRISGRLTPPGTAFRSAGAVGGL